MGVFKTSLKKKDLEEGKLLKVDINDKSLVLTRVIIMLWMQFVLMKADL